MNLELFIKSETQYLNIIRTTRYIIFFLFLIFQFSMVILLIYSMYFSLILRFLILSISNVFCSRSLYFVEVLDRS